MGHPWPVVRVIDFRSVVHITTVGFQSCLGLWILSCQVAIQLAYGESMVLFSCLLETKNAVWPVSLLLIGQIQIFMISPIDHRLEKGKFIQKLHQGKGLILQPRLLSIFEKLKYLCTEDLNLHKRHIKLEKLVSN